MGMIDFAVGHKPSRAALLRGELPAWIRRSPRASYIKAVLLSTPPWVDSKALRALQARARWETEMSGGRTVYHLDHVIPLTHPLVCGLTVPCNLRVAPDKSNLSKGNTWTPDQLALPGIEDMHTYLERRAAGSALA
jgi:hypothetical protein